MEEMICFYLFVIDEGYGFPNIITTLICVYSTLSDGHPLPPVRSTEKKQLNVSNADPLPAMLTPDDDVVGGKSSPETALQKCNS